MGRGTATTSAEVVKAGPLQGIAEGNRGLNRKEASFDAKQGENSRRLDENHRRCTSVHAAAAAWRLDLGIREADRDQLDIKFMNPS